MSSLTILSFETILCVDVRDDLILMAESEVSLDSKMEIMVGNQRFED